MTYEQALDFEQQQYQANQQIGEDLFLEGKADGAFGYMPQYADSTYLEGYCAGVKELPRSQDGRINYFPADPKQYAKQIENAPVAGRKPPRMVRGFAID